MGATAAAQGARGVAVRKKSVRFATKRVATRGPSWRLRCKRFFDVSANWSSALIFIDQGAPLYDLVRYCCREARKWRLMPPIVCALPAACSRRCCVAILEIDRQGTKMSNRVKMLTEQARALPLHDRIALVEDVLDSLDRADPDIDRLWAREASDRLAAYRRGELAARDLRDIIAIYRP